MVVRTVLNYRVLTGPSHGRQCGILLYAAVALIS